jgi:hypothetical protein
VAFLSPVIDRFSTQQLWQLRDVSRDPPRLVFGEPGSTAAWRSLSPIAANGDARKIGTIILISLGTKSWKHF